MTSVRAVRPRQAHIMKPIEDLMSAIRVCLMGNIGTSTMACVCRSCVCVCRVCCASNCARLSGGCALLVRLDRSPRGGRAVHLRCEWRRFCCTIRVFCDCITASLHGQNIFFTCVCTLIGRIYGPGFLTVYSGMSRLHSDRAGVAHFT